MTDPSVSSSNPNGVYFNDVNGAYFSEEPIIRRWVQSGNIEEFTTPTAKSGPFYGSSFPPYEVTTDGGIRMPKVGQIHPVYSGAVLSRINVQPMKIDSAWSFHTELTWEQSTLKSMIVSDVYNQQIEKSYDINGKVTAVTPPPGVVLPQSPTTYVAPIRVPQLITSFSIMQYELIPTNISLTLQQILNNLQTTNQQALINSGPVWGFGSGELLYLGKKIIGNGTPLNRAEYRFMVAPYNQRWDVFTAFWHDQRGVIPAQKPPMVLPPLPFTPDSKWPPGITSFEMLQSAPFATALASIYQPWKPR